MHFCLGQEPGASGQTTTRRTTRAPRAQRIEPGHSPAARCWGRAFKGCLELQDPFHGRYLFTDENEDHNKVDIDKELPDIVASFLYQKVISANDMVWDSLKRLETFENMDFKPKNRRLADIPEPTAYSSPLASSRLPIRGRRNPRIHDLCLREVCTTIPVVQAIPKAVESFGEFVKQKETLQRWHITDEHQPFRGHPSRRNKE